MARLKTDQKRDRQLNVALKSDEFALLQKRADAAGLRLVSYARALLLNEEIRRETVVMATTVDRLAYQQWVRVGSNLNQIARQLNALGSVPASEMEAVLQELRALIVQARP